MAKSALLRLICVLGVYCFARLGLSGQLLSLSLTDGDGGLALSWPLWATDGVLEQSTNLQSSAAWKAVPTAYYQTDTTGVHYAVPAREGSRFYRVRRVGPVVPGQVGYWSLDEGSGTVAADQTGSGGSLYLTNVVWTTGRTGSGSLRFNGQDLSAGGSLAWLSNTNYQVLPPAGMPFSVSLWFSPDTISTGWQGIIGNDAGGVEGWHVALNTPGPGTNYLVLAGAGNGSSLSVTGRAVLLPGQWHQLTVSYGNDQSSLYLDSRLLAQGSGSLLNSPNRFYLGGTAAGYTGFAGRLDEIRIYTNVLSQEQVSVTGHWHFDENAGSLAADSSIQGHPAAVVVSAAWAPGKTNSGVDLSAGPIVIPNDDYRVLPPSGDPFSVSCWLQARDLPVGRSGLLYCGDGTGRGWQLTIDAQGLAPAWLELTSTNLGGTLALRAPASLTNAAWTKLDLTYNGGIATVYINGCKVQSEQGAIRAAPFPLVVGAVPGASNFNGVVDELKIYSRDREAAEIGPVASAMWETAWVSTNTDLILQGTGPPGKPLTYSLLSALAPSLGTITYSPERPIVSYQAGTQKGPDSFAYTVSDGEFISPPATAVVSVVAPHWLAPGGGTLLPLDGSSPERAWVAGPASALDAIWKTNNYYDCFFYDPGEFQTTGHRFMQRSTANPGCKHIGSGAEGPAATIIKLVDARITWEEGIIFAPLHQNAYCDGFEVHNLVLDCNSQNNPKYAPGEPVSLWIPLAATARVDSVTLHWSDAAVAGSYNWRSGRPAEFTVCTRAFTAKGYSTNCLALVSTGLVDVINIAAETDQLLIQLNRRAAGVDFYGLAEVGVSGAAVSLPMATIPGGGESRLDAEHSVLMAFDGDPKTSWASGPENQAQITVPVAVGTPIRQLNLRWNCQTLTNLSRLGPAAAYLIYARDETTGQLLAPPFVSHGRDADGSEVVTFGTALSTNDIITDQLSILLVARDQGVDYYSLREVSLENEYGPVPPRIPTASSSLVWDKNRSFLKAFDGNLSTEWASGTQGSTGAAEVRGSNLKFQGLKVIGFGTKAVKECFPLLVLAPEPSVYHPELFRNVLVEDCAFVQPATNNSDGVSVLVVAGQGTGRLVNAAVRRCTVAGVRSYFTYSHGITAPLVENCLVDDCEAAVYFEPDAKGWTDSIGPVLIRTNQFRNVVLGISVDFHPEAHFDSLACQDNEITLSATASTQRYGIRICDVCLPGPSASITNLLALRNTVRYPDWAPRLSPVDGGLVYTDIRHAVFGDNLLVLDPAVALRVRQYPAGIVPNVPTPEDCDHPGLVWPGPSTYPPSLDALPPGYRRAWYNNRNLSGLLLPIHYTQWGFDRPASQ
ncbi:MAG TPA: LamG-like jellyroll fold domain-containing protein, partial [Verrucomicrobiae bacterium]